MGEEGFTHLKERLDEKLKFNEGWWFHDLRRTGKTTMSEHLDIKSSGAGSDPEPRQKDMDKAYNNADPAKARRADQVEQYVIAVVQGQTKAPANVVGIDRAG